MEPKPPREELPPELLPRGPAPERIAIAASGELATVPVRSRVASIAFGLGLTPKLRLRPNRLYVVPDP